VRRSRALSLGAFAACGAALSALAAGCGQASQDAHEPRGSYTVQIVRAHLPARQRLARGTALEIAVHNAGTQTVPNLAVTVDSLNYVERYPDLADPNRPVWIIMTGPGPVAKPPVETTQLAPPGGGETAHVNTWALGPLAPGHTRVFTWKLMPVRAGLHRVHFLVAAGLHGKARALLASGAKPSGELVAQIAPRPLHMHVDAVTGQVVPGQPPVSSGPVGAVP
jgi:hypothetical protein